MRNDHKWIEEFYKEPVVMQIMDDTGGSGSDELVNQAFEICHGIMAYATDYNCANEKIQGLWALIRKYEFEDCSCPNWDENPFGEEVYNYLEAEQYGVVNTLMTWDDLAAAIAKMPPERRRDNATFHYGAEDEYFAITTMKVAARTDTLDKGHFFMEGR